MSLLVGLVTKAAFVFL